MSEEIKKLENARGQVSRSKFVCKILEQYLRALSSNREDDRK